MIELDIERVDVLIKLALEEDLGEVGDATTISVVPDDLVITVRLVARENCIVAGMPVAEKVFKTVDENITFKSAVTDGAVCVPGALLAEITGNAGKLLTAERTVLNFLQRLSGVATA